MNAPTPQGAFVPDENKSIEEQMDLPGIVKADPAEAAADSDEPASPQNAGEFSADFLSLEELIEQIKTKKPDFPEADIEGVRKLYESINERTGNKLVIPRTAEGATQDNADLAVELYNSTKLGQKRGNFFNRKLETVFGNASENGVVKMREGGVFFYGTGGLFSKKTFSQEDARQIALLAMHNKDLLPPNAVKITGNKEQRLMIKAEMDKLNEMLPEAARFTLTAKQAKQFEATAPAAKAPEAATPAEPAEAAPSPVTEARLAAMAEPPTENPYQETDLKYSLAEVMSENLNEDRNGAIANAKPIGQLAKFGYDAYETTYKDSDSDATTTIQFADLGEERGLKVIRIEPNGPFPGYQSTPYVVLDRTDGVELSADLGGTPVVKTPLAGNFDAVGSGKPLTQADPTFIGPRTDFIGPRTPAGWTPPGL